ncbi:sulfatase [uncultured Polaribacter sp.]|uniref:sulfatase family protein n=1 Tax=uncultured Polaribacter sp. TaxID=174711 RepID=UPI00261F4EC0|nr:sulfatase [uncultured Polaribacter sp.]
MMKENKIKNTIFLILISLFIFGCSSSTKGDKKINNKPNIILFVTDDHGLDALGAYGNKVIKTPNLDKLASEGITFSNAYCTSASCTASRSVILSGKFGHATGSYGHSHSYHHFSTYSNETSLPIIMEKYGYQTARIGKYHIAPEKVYHFNTILEADPRNTIEMAEKSKPILNSEKPFFLYFCTDDPHRGKSTNPKKWNAPNSFGNKKEGYKGTKQITYKPNEVLVPSFLSDTKETREEIAEYYQSVSRVDQGFGKLMKLLKESGKAENTIVIYISDNGMAFPGAKTTVYEPGIKLPCIIKDPTRDLKGITNKALISWVDLTPTILDMAKIDYNKAKFHGESFNSILEKTNPKGWDEIYASHTFHEVTMYYPMRVVRNKNYKLIWNISWRQEYPFASDLLESSSWQSIQRNNLTNFGNKKINNFLFRPQFELYDLKKDPNELNNLASEKEFETVFISLKSKLKEFQINTNDPWKIIWDKNPL